MATSERPIRVADEAWVALALLQYEHADRDLFSAKEILDRVKAEDDPILQMRGVGKEIWADTNADDYVRSLRADWYGDKRPAGS